MQDHINWFPVMLQLKIPQVSREGWKLLLPQGHSKILKNRTEWLLLKELYSTSLQKVGIWRNHWQDRMGNTGSICWSYWGSCSYVGILGSLFMVSSPSDFLHNLWEIISLSTPKFPRHKTGGLTISLLAILCNYTRQGLFGSVWYPTSGSVKAPGCCCNSGTFNNWYESGNVKILQVLIARPHGSWNRYIKGLSH